MIIRPSLLWKELLLFALAQGLGLWTATQINFARSPILPKNADFGFKDLVWLVVFVVIFFLLISKGKKVGRGVIRVFLVLAVIAGSQIVLASFLNLEAASLIGIAVGLLFLFFRNVLMHNAAMILSLAGIGVAFGASISPIFAIGILLALSIYDIIAVYGTRHMVTMAEEMIRSENIFGLVIPEKTKNMSAPMHNVEPGQGFMILGSGDVVMPIILAASASVTSLQSAFVVALFGIGGFFVTYLLFINQKIRRPMAALPPIAVASIIGYLITVLLKLN